MEDTICDYNIYRMAQLLGKTDEAAYYKNRALNYVNYYNADLGWYMARNTDGSFRYTDAETFDPSAWHEKSNWDYCETNAWNMIFSAVQDVQGMINLYGGEEAALELSLIHISIGGLGVDGVFIAEPISNAVGGIASFTTMMLTVWRKLGKMETQSLPAAEAEETTGENVPAAP